MAELDDIISEPSEVEKRIKELSGKVKLTSEERDEAKRLSEEKDGKLVEKDREIDFLSGFSDIVAKNPMAQEHKNDIKAKVLAGYTVEDATFAVLGKAGKLNQPVAEPRIVSGGSAPTTLPSGGSKNIGEMTQDERRAAILSAEKNGDISIS